MMFAECPFAFFDPGLQGVGWVDNSFFGLEICGICNVSTVIIANARGHCIRRIHFCSTLPNGAGDAFWG